MTTLDTGTEDLRAEINDGVAVITMNRPERRNAFSQAMLSALGAVLAQVETDEAVGCVVLTGAGGAFCAGGDVKAMATPPDGRGGDGGYMAIFQVPDLAAARRRLAGLGARVVWTADLPDIAATHLHPRDVPGAIVSLDWAAPEESWRWAGPSWTGRAPEHAPGGVTGLTIEVADPSAAARRWAAVLGIPASGGNAAVTVLPESGQRLQFVPARAGTNCSR